MSAELVKYRKEISCSQNFTAPRECCSVRRTYYGSSYEKLVEKKCETQLRNLQRKLNMVSDVTAIYSWGLLLYWGFSRPTCLLMMFSGLALPAAAASSSACRRLVLDGHRSFFVGRRLGSSNVGLPGGCHRCAATSSSDLRRPRRLFTICHTRRTDWQHRPRHGTVWRNRLSQPTDDIGRSTFSERSIQLAIRAA